MATKTRRRADTAVDIPMNNKSRPKLHENHTEIRLTMSSIFHNRKAIRRLPTKTLGQGASLTKVDRSQIFAAKQVVDVPERLKIWLKI